MVGLLSALHRRCVGVCVCVFKHDDVDQQPSFLSKGNLSSSTCPILKYICFRIHALLDNRDTYQQPSFMFIG